MEPASSSFGVCRESVRYHRRVLVAAILCCVAFSNSAFAQSDGGAPIAAQIQSRLDALQFETDLMAEATALATRGDIAGAWELLAADGAAPGQMGFRLAAVAGFLRNQSKGAAADQLARLGLTKGWSDVRKLKPGKERGEVSYWCAWLAAEALDDRPLALQWLTDADAHDPGSERARALRSRLEDAGRARSGR